MKKLHKLNIILVLAVAGGAAFLLKEGLTLKANEANLAQELSMLREAVKHAPSAAKPLATKPSLDAEKFISELKTVLDSSNQEALKDLLSLREPQLTSASAAQLKEIASWLEEHYPIASKEKSLAQITWGVVMGSLAKSDPSGAIAKLEQVASSSGVTPVELLPMLKRWGGEPMALPYATALRKWLDAAQADGHLDADLPMVAKLRAGIAAAEGNQSAAVKEIVQLPYSSQRDAAIRHAQTLQGLEESRQALEELSSGLHFQNFQRFVSSLAIHQGFDAAREILATASLTAEHHDLALASIAGSNIGPETKERAAWLLTSLRSEDHRALENFASQWSQGDHVAAATWVNTLPTGSRRDSALRGLIPVVARIDGASAMDWALTVTEPLLRNELYCGAHVKWSETDAARADAYRKENPLDHEAVKAASKP